jgi:trigger factor
LEITLDKKNNIEGLIKIRLTEGDYQLPVEEKVKDFARKASIKGFRPGKVPNGVIKKMFGKSILVDEINHLLTSKLTDYIKENKLKILGDPIPNLDKSRDIDWDNQKDFEFEYQIGMVEEFTYNLSSKAKIKGYTIDVDSKVIDETITDLKKRFGKVSYPETSEAGHNLFGELRASDGAVESQVKNEQSFIAIPDVTKKEQKKFIGLKKGDEVEFQVEKLFEDEDKKAQLLQLTPEEAKDAKGSYIFKVNTISDVEPAEINQELFERVFGKDTVKSEEEFVNKIKETISENYKRETDHFLEHYIEDYFIENTKINLPDDFLKMWLKKSSEGEVTDEVLTKEFESYKRGLKWDLVKNKIAEDNNLSVDAEAVRNKAKELIVAQFGGQAFAEQIKDRLDAFADNYLSNENGKNFTRLYNQLRNEKILGHIKQHITIDEKKVGLEEFKKIVKEHKH